MAAHNSKCPICQAPATCLAVIPRVAKGGKVILGGDYGVCEPCHADQYKEFYGFTPAEAPSKAPPDEIEWE